MDNLKVEISVIIISYNHEKYIRQAINSVLMQCTNVKYEIIIGDDFSRDSTRIIIQEYADKYPKIITAILRDQNIGATKNFYDLLSMCKGKYIAALEGDDFWNNVHKLQNQYCFLESNDYIAVYNNVAMVDENSSIIDDKYPGHKKELYTINDWKKWIIPGQLGGAMFKNLFYNSIEDYSIIFRAHSIVADRTLALILALKGDIFCSDEIYSSYRFITNGESFSSYSIKGKYKNESYYYFLQLFEYYEDITREKLDSFILEKNLLTSCLVYVANNGIISNYKLPINTFKNLKHKFLCLCYLIIKLPMKLFCRTVQVFRKCKVTYGE